MNNPLVSVCMITYNHELYIREAIEGVLMQKTSFPIELIISEDCSTDNTRKIVSEYAEKYPEIIVADLPDKNRGATDNFIHCVSVSSGKYIALCEGDDYWTDPLKLQKQVDFLESNPNYSLCWHNRIICENGIERADSALQMSDKDIDSTDILTTFIPTLTSVFINPMILNPNEVKWITLDASLWIFLSQYGKGRQMSFVAAAYRKHDGGIWSNSSSLVNYNRSIKAREICFKYMSLVDKKKLAYVISTWKFNRAKLLLDNKQFFCFIKDYISLIKYSICSKSNMHFIKINKVILKKIWSTFQ